ncbi:hypothetical protein SAMN05216299_12035 [Nitrosospira sp. Nsp14]|nr:hypothetical protein SAMN05216299_12035 [Nitrosospira sp. Nsp14]
MKSLAGSNRGKSIPRCAARVGMNRSNSQEE